MRILFPIIAVSCCAVCMAHADGTNAEMAIMARSYIFQSDTDIRNDATIVDHYLETLGTRNDILNRFGPLSELSWSINARLYGYDIHHQYTSAGRNALVNMAGNSLRETLLQELPIEEWKDTGECLWDRLIKNGAVGTFFVNMFAGSLGNTDERSIELVSAAPTDASIERAASWWQQVKTANKLEYGRHDAYMYARFDAGHHMGGVPILHMDMRCSLNPPGSLNQRDFQRAIKYEQQAILSLPAHCQIVCGISFYPMESESYGDRLNASIRFEHLIFRTSRKCRDYSRQFAGIVSFGAWTNGEHTIFNVSMYRMF